MAQTVRIPASPVGVDFRDLAGKISSTLTRLGFVEQPKGGHTGSYSWMKPGSTWGGETLWKLAFWGATDWDFGVREDYVEEAGKTAKVAPLCPETFCVKPKESVKFIGVSVKNDAGSLAAIMKIIDAVTT